MRGPRPKDYALLTSRQVLEVLDVVDKYKEEDVKELALKAWRGDHSIIPGGWLFFEKGENWMFIYDS